MANRDPSRRPRPRGLLKLVGHQPFDVAKDDGQSHPDAGEPPGEFNVRPNPTRPPTDRWRCASLIGSEGSKATSPLLNAVASVRTLNPTGSRRVDAGHQILRVRHGGQAVSSPTSTKAVRSARDRP